MVYVAWNYFINYYVIYIYIYKTNFIITKRTNFTKNILFLYKKE